MTIGPGKPTLADPWDNIIDVETSLPSSER